MTWIDIFLHEVAGNLKKWRWWIVTVALTLLFAMSAWTFRDLLRQEESEYERSRSTLMETFAALKTGADLRLASLETMKRPEVATWVVFGIERLIPNSVRFNLIERRLETFHSLQKNLFLTRANYLDWVFILTNCLTLAAVFFGHDSISGELAGGVLKLTLSQPISRASFLAAKSAGLLTTLGAALTIAVCLGVATLALLDVELSSSDLLIFGVAVFLTVLLSGVFLMASVWASILTRSSESALIWGVLVWIVLVVLAPGAARIGGALLSPTASPEAVRAEISERQREMLRKPSRESLDEFQQVRAEIQKRYQEQLSRQAATAGWLAAVSPVWSYQNALSRLTDCGLPRHLRFLAETQAVLLRLTEFAERRDQAKPPSYDLFKAGVEVPSLATRLAEALKAAVPLLIALVLCYFGCFLCIARLSL